MYSRTACWRAGLTPGRTTSWGNLRQRAFQTLAHSVPPGQVLGRAGVVRKAELFVLTPKHGGGTFIGTQPQNPAPGMFDHAPGFEYDLLHHSPHAPLLGRMAQRIVFADECVLTNQSLDVYALASASDGFFLGVRVSHHKGVPAHGHISARQGTIVHRARGVLGRKQGQVEPCSELKPRGRMGVVHALTQDCARGYCANVQGAGKKGIASALPNAIEVVLALHQQAQVELQNVVVGDATDSCGKFAVNHSIDAKALGILPNRFLSSVGGKVAGEFIVYKVGRMVCSSCADSILHINLLSMKINQHLFDVKSRIQDTFSSIKVNIAARKNYLLMLAKESD